MTSDRSPLGALWRGLADVLRAPLLLIGITIVTVVIAAPFAAVLQSRLQESLSVQPQISLADTEIDAEWWMEFRAHARGLAATFTPAVLGFAATLDGISAVLDGRGIPFALLTPLALSVVAWAVIWAAALRRFQHGRGIGLRGVVQAGATYAWPFVVIAAVAAIVNLALYLTVHRLLFGPVHDSLVAMTATERDAFFVRVVLYAVFFSLVAGVSLVADYARVAAVVGRATSPVQMIRVALGFLSERTAAVLALYLMTGALFVAITIAYGALEISGGSQVGGWRAIAIGQAYVLVRLGIRLTFAASELRLFTANQSAVAQ